MLLRQFFDPDLAHYSYLLACPHSGEGLLVDPHRDLDRYLSAAQDAGVEIVAVAETHIHADFLSGARELVDLLGVRAFLSAEGGSEWQYAWEPVHPSGEVVRLRDSDLLRIGSVELRVLATPGHTPEHLCFLVTDRASATAAPLGLLTGDFLLVGDLGRPDLLDRTAGSGGSRYDAARALFRSLSALDALPDHLLVWPAHGAGSSCGKSIGAVPVSSLGYERRGNVALRTAAEGEDAFVAAILEDQPTPPLYFGRMKRVNRTGPPPLRRLPSPRRLDRSSLAGVVAHGETVVIDTRSRGEFMAAHLPASLHAPLGRSFSTAVGSVLTEETRQIVLVAEERGLERVLRDLVRMGYDRIVGYAEPDELRAFLRMGGDAASIAAIGFEQVLGHYAAEDAAVVDVRDHFEYDGGHIPGAVNAPYTRLPEYLSERIPEGRLLLVHCESGMRSAVAAAWLASRGREVLFVDDDWSRWSELGGRVEKGAASPEA